MAILVSMIISIVGLVGTIKTNTCLMLIHAFMCCSVLGAFYVFLLIDCFLRKEQYGTESIEHEA